MEVAFASGGMGVRDGVPAGGRSIPRAFGVALLFAALALTAARAPSTAVTPPAVRIDAGASGVVVAMGGVPATSGGGYVVVEGASQSRSAVCGFGSADCPAGAGAVHVGLSVSFSGARGPLSFDRVDVAFVLETTPYDGVADYPGNGSCAPAAMGLCNEGDSVPTFDSYSATILSAIQASHPESHVAFGLVDGFAAYDHQDDGDGSPFHVDIPNFTSSPQAFASELNLTLRTTVLTSDDILNDSDLADNVLHGSQISAIYGTIAGGALNWTSPAHRVVVWIGSTAPRDPSYPENYSNWNTTCTGTSCFSPTCEPSRTFASGAAFPDCEGWVDSQDGNASHSIAALARSSEACVDSAGFSCTIDVVNPRTVPTDPGLQGWGLRNGTLARTDTRNILDAGCDLSRATGGSWDGPSNFTCPGGPAGTLAVHWRGASGVDTTFVRAVENVSLGAVPDLLSAPTGASLFTFVPGPGVGLAPVANESGSCTNNSVPVSTCQTVPVVQSSGGLTVLRWNWSGSAGENGLRPGDTWNAAFDLVVNVRENGTYPLDRCDGSGCSAAGSGPVDGVLSAFDYRDPMTGAIVADSFPLLNVTVEAPAAPALTASERGSPGYPPTAVAFVSNATGGVPPYSYAWDFGDGYYGSGADVNHTYTFAGEFTATVTVRDRSGALADQQLIVSVYPIPGPVSVVLNATPSTLTVGTPITLRSNVGGGYLPLTYGWSGLPAGCATANLSTIGCRPTAAGSYSVHLKVTDARGGSANASADLTVNPSLAIVLTVTHPPEGCLGVPTPFNFSATVTGGTSPFVYAWNFGDGATSRGSPFANHTFAGAADHSVSLLVTDASGANGSGGLVVANAGPHSCGPIPVTNSGGIATSVSPFWVTVAVASAIVIGVGAILYRDHQRRVRE